MIFAFMSLPYTGRKMSLTYAAREHAVPNVRPVSSTRGVTHALAPTRCMGPALALVWALRAARRITIAVPDRESEEEV